MKNIKLYLIFCMCVITIQNSTAQVETSPFDKSLQQLTDGLASKLVSSKQLKLGVWDLSTLDGTVSPIGKYIAEDIAINLSDKFHVVNRNQLQTLKNENHLRDKEGMIDPATIKEYKQLSDIDMIVTGTVSILSDHIKITIQALDVDANIVAAVKGEVPMNSDVKELLGINTDGSSRGFNNPLNSNEHANNPKSVDKDCESKHTGDYCFANSTNNKLIVKLLKPNGNVGDAIPIIIEIGQTQCAYNLDAAVYTYRVWKESDVWDKRAGNLSSYEWSGIEPDERGQIRIEQCQSKTFIIK